MSVSAQELISALIQTPAPRPDAIAIAGGRKLFPTWQAVLVGAPVGVIAASMLGLVAALAVALPLGAVVGKPLPPWFGRMSEAVMVVGALLGIWLVVRWMRGRRAHFVELVRSGSVVPAFDVAATGLAGALGTRAGKTVARVALGAVGGTVAQVYGGPIAVAELDGQRIEARTAADSRGRFRVPEFMLVDRTGRYVALLDRTGWIAPQRVLRRSAMA
ncbi:MAG: hypothetical protein JWP01_1903 [Myxococcales bacterium]|nr:hypothetical protein [Myxococcales bacterium]